MKALVVKLKCPKCSITFKEQTEYERHITSVHLKVELHKCKDCDAKFFNKSRLERHKKEHLNVKSTKKFVCVKCYACFEKKHHLELHSNSVHLNLMP